MKQFAKKVMLSLLSSAVLVANIAGSSLAFGWIPPTEEELMDTVIPADYYFGYYMDTYFHSTPQIYNQAHNLALANIQANVVNRDGKHYLHFFCRA